MEQFRQVMAVISNAVDSVGVLIVVTGTFAATFRFLASLRNDTEKAWRLCRQRLGRSILLSLEFLIVGDIIRTVVISPTLENVYVLGLIVLIRTFLSFALQLELDGRWPWQRLQPVSDSPTFCADEAKTGH